MPQFVKRAGLLALVFALYLLYLELVSFGKLRVANLDTDVIPKTTLVSAYPGEPWAAALATEWAPSNHYAYEAYVGWERKPFQGKVINIDEPGVRRSAHSHCDQPGLTIWAFGGSTTWGYGAPDWLTIPSQLAGQYEKAGHNVCIKNYGEKAWVNTQEMVKLVLELKHASRKPDLVIFYDGPADVWETYQSGRAGAHQNFDDTKRLFEGHAAAVAGSFQYLLDSNAGRLFWRQHQSDSQKSATKDIRAIATLAIRCYLENVTLIQALGREYHFQPAFFWEPTISTGHKPLTPTENAARSDARQQFPGLDEANQLTYSLLQPSCHAPIYCIADALDQATDTVYFDENHVTAEGNRLVAERMYNTLQPARD